MTPIPPIPEDLKQEYVEVLAVLAEYDKQNDNESRSNFWQMTAAAALSTKLYLESIAKLTAEVERLDGFLTDANAALMDYENRESDLKAENTRLKAALTKPIETDEARRVGLPLECDDPDEVKAIERLYASRATRTPQAEKEDQ